MSIVVKNQCAQTSRLLYCKDRACDGEGMHSMTRRPKNKHRFHKIDGVLRCHCFFLFAKLGNSITRSASRSQQETNLLGLANVFYFSPGTHSAYGNHALSHATIYVYLMRRLA